MKKSWLILLVLLMPVALFANGNGDNKEFKPRWQAEGVELELKTFSGTLVLEEGKFPELNTGDGIVLLKARGLNLDQLDLQNGDQISVKGYEMPGPYWAKENYKFVHIVSATIKGKEYIFSGPRGSMGPKGGRKGGRGRGFGPIHGQLQPETPADE
jgi:hypothetical protein